MPMKDFSLLGVSIQRALLLDRAQKGGDVVRGRSVLWGKVRVQTSDWIQIPPSGRVKITLLKYAESVRHAVDLRIPDGHLILDGGERVSLLRTWADPDYEDQMEYAFESSGEICVTTASETQLANGQRVLEQFTGNSGFWIEKQGDSRIYHASYASADPPNFESLVFSVQVWDS